MTNEKSFRKMMTILGEIHDRKITRLILDVYWKVLMPYSDEQCLAVFHELIRLARFFPKPVDFLEVMETKREDEATTAWLQVLVAVRRVGNYQSVSFPAPIIHSVIEAMGGWVRLGLMEEKELAWKRKEFERLYQVFARHWKSGHPQHLPGIHEIHNAAESHDQRVVQIGMNDRRLIP